MVFQQRETEVGAAVIQTAFFQPGSEFCVSTVARVDIIFPTRPDALVAVGRSNILLARFSVSNQIDALYAFQGRFPVRPVVSK